MIECCSCISFHRSFWNFSFRISFFIGSNLRVWIRDYFPNHVNPNKQMGEHTVIVQSIHSSTWRNAKNKEKNQFTQTMNVNMLWIQISNTWKIQLKWNSIINFKRFRIFWFFTRKHKKNEIGFNLFLLSLRPSMGNSTLSFIAGNFFCSKSKWIPNQNPFQFNYRYHIIFEKSPSISIKCYDVGLCPRHE